MVIIYQELNKDLYKLKLIGGGGGIKNVILMILLFYLPLFK